MKSRTLRKIIAATTLVLGVAISVTSSLSWFDETVKIETENVTGVSEGAYFHSGNGTKDYPYTITRKRHLYNLAWLQYLGYFATKDSSGNMSGKQNTVYFRLLNDVDMDGMNIPPIGTSEYPFIGNFDGQGYKVTNFTSTNDYSDFTGVGQKHPYTVTTENFKNNQVKIVGFFGVVGSIGDSSNYTYDSEKNQVKNVGLDKFEVKSKATDTLVGLAAGYVNGELASVAVNNGKLNLTSEAATTALDSTNLTSNVSDYSIVGYATDPYKTKVTKVSQSAYKVTRAVNQEFVVQEDGDENAYGSSIDMKSVTQRLLNIRNTGTWQSFDYRRSYDYHSGVKDSTYTAISTENASTYNRTGTVLLNNNDKIGHFLFVNSSNSYVNRYALLGGGHYEVSNYYELADHKQFVITNGAYYIYCNGTTIDKTTNGSNATTFEMDSTGKIFYKFNNSTYYLRNYNGNLAATNNESYATSWGLNDDGTYRIINAQNYYIKFDTTSESWVLDTCTITYSISYQNTNNNLAVNNTNLTNSNTSSPIWYLNSLTGTTQIYTIINGQQYYLYRNNYGNLRLDRNNQTTWNIEKNGNYLRFYYRSAYYGNYYLSFNNSWGLRQNTTYADLLLTQYISNTSSNIQKTTLTTISKAGPDEVLKETKTGMNYQDQNVTYFPLNTKDNTSNFEPIDKNSGYIIAGSSIGPTNTWGSYFDEITNVRFGYYSISDSLTNYDADSNSFTTMYTINDNLSREEIPTSNNLVRYNDAVNGMLKVLKNQTNVYGLHFMSSTITEDATTIAKYAKINKQVYENYEFPVNAIDFNLSELGYVNFIAGSYYTNDGTENNSFFSLYQIERTEDEPKKINRILEIENVYKHNSGNEAYSYVYELKHNNETFYTKPYKIIDNAGHKEFLDGSAWQINQYEDSLPEDYSIAFKVARIRKNNVSLSNFQNRAYYFEIPMNDGEFCLGSVEGAYGSYLMYLDIAANAQNVARSVFTEYFLRTDEEFDFPVGVAVVSNVAIINTHTATTDQKVYASDSVTIVIRPGYQDELILSRDTSGAILTRSTTSSLAAPSYKEANLSLKENGTEITEFVATRTTQYETIRNIIVDRDTRLQTTTITVIEENYIDGELDGSRTVNQYSESIAEANLIPAADRKYYQLDPIKSTGKKIEESALEIIQPDKTNVLITYTYLMQDGSTSTNTFVLDFTKETDTNYYTADGYTINVTLTPAEGSEDTLVMTVTVLNKNGEVISINSITINGTGPVA